MEIDREYLRRSINKHFDLSELKTLCFDLRIDFESLVGESKVDKIRELILHCERQNLLPGLINTLQQERPQVSWLEGFSLFDSQNKGRKQNISNVKMNISHSLMSYGSLRSQLNILSDSEFRDMIRTILSVREQSYLPRPIDQIGRGDFLGYMQQSNKLLSVQNYLNENFSDRLI